MASWHYPNGTAARPLATSTDDYLQIQIRTDVDLIRNKDAVDINPLNNGLWTCRLGDEFVPVGIYQRNGKCNHKITAIIVCELLFRIQPHHY